MPASFGLNKYDTVADIGSYDGHYPLVYSIFSDSVAFYLNDISDAGFTYFDSIETECNKIKGSPVSNKFIMMIGSDTCTNLPARFFRKVIVRDALHHFKQPDKMLADIKRIMKPKPGAKLLLFEPIRDMGDNKNLCAGAMTKEELLKTMNRSGFILLREQSPLKNTGSWFEFSIKYTDEK